MPNLNKSGGCWVQEIYFPDILNTLKKKNPNDISMFSNNQKIIYHDASFKCLNQFKDF